MKIHIELTEAEAADFLEFRRNSGKYKTMESRVKILCQRVRDAVAPLEGNPGQYVIADQDHADDLWNTVQIFR